MASRDSVDCEQTLAGEWIGIEAIGDGVWDVYFGPVHLGQFDERLPSGRQGDYLSLRV